ncbi:MAG: serine/threonine-protein kinase, partial [Vicinamibacterales bacterium]|nr:serine/threonine-protein kinase [Vicinamibacterales bacterium]
LSWDVSTRSDQAQALLARVCDAVHHAHQRGVIHRDLKPGNILVDAAGQPKILDFGIARVTDSDIQATMQTDVGQLLGTLPYMSPEQVEADVLDLDTRSDVYALGVVLYQLLADRLPYEVSGRPVTEAARVITEEEPAALRTLNRSLDRDIELVVRKALEKERTRRYQSAAELAADIRRYLANEPIEARAPTTAYQLHQFARRHRAIVGGVAATVLALLVGLAATGYWMFEARAERDRAAAERDRAEGEATKATAINDFLQNTLSSANPYEGSGREVTVFAALGSAVDTIDDAFADQPEISAAVEDTIGRTYRDLGEYDRAEPLLRSALETRQQILGADDPDVAQSLNALGELLLYQGDYEAAEPLWREALDLRRTLFGDTHPDVAEMLSNLAIVHQIRGDYAAAEAMNRDALAVLREALGDEHEDVATSLNNLANVLAAQGDYEAVAPLHREALAIRRAVLADDHPDLSLSLLNLATALTELGDYAEAESLYREAVATYRTSLGEQHPRVAAALNNLAAMLLNRGDYDEAEALQRDALAMQRAVLGEMHGDVAVSLSNLGTLFRLKGDLDAAEPFHRDALAIRRTVLGEQHPDVAGNLNDLAALLRDKGDYAAAVPLHRDALDIFRRSYGADHWLVGRVQRDLGWTLTGLGRYEEAEDVLLASQQLLQGAFDGDHVETQAAVERLIDLYEAWDRPDRAAEYRALRRSP